MLDQQKLENWFNNFSLHQDDLNWLSNTLIEIATYLYYHNTEMAHAELIEVEAATKLITDPSVEKKISVAEADKRAITLSGNRFGELKAQRDAIIEILNAIKIRVRVLESEREVSKLT